MQADRFAKGRRTRSGYCALTGRSNVGKSTLLNRLVGARISAIADKPQTTRHNIRGILTSQDTQIVFVDTPGIHLEKPHLLNRAMNRDAEAALQDVDLVVFVVECGVWREEEDRILNLLAALDKPVLLCVNKVDRQHRKEDLLPMLAQLSRKFPFEAIIPVSALKGDNLVALETEIRARLPHSSEFPFPVDQLSDRDECSIAADLIQEQLTCSLQAELPYSIFVEVETFDERVASTSIAATIWVSRNSHKGIVIGKSGRKLKLVGSRARASIEALLGRRVYLQLWVKVKPNWQNDPKVVAKLTG